LPRVTTSLKRANQSLSRGPAAAVRRAVASVSPTVTMWRDGLTIIALESRELNRPPDYVTFEQALKSSSLVSQPPSGRGCVCVTSSICRRTVHRHEHEAPATRRFCAQRN